MSECPAITINIGLVGYRDITEYLNWFYTNIDLTNSYTYLESVINSLYPSGGGDVPEDIAGALEMTLHKSWKNNARFLIFIADAPCHGPKYYQNSDDKYPDGGENRRNIEVLIKELAEKNISLFCIKLRTTTDIMFNIFSDIYKDYNDFEFKIVSMTNKQSMSNIIINSAIEVYASQRNADI